MGCILTRDLVRGIYRIQFDRPDMGVHRCLDTDILVRIVRNAASARMRLTPVVSRCTASWCRAAAVPRPGVAFHIWFAGGVHAP